MDPSASIIMGAALVFYSIGVWGERISGRLKWWHSQVSSRLFSCLSMQSGHLQC